MVCTTITIAAPAPTLAISSPIQAGLDGARVYMTVVTTGTGTGILKLSWGNIHDETKTGIVAGARTYYMPYDMPPGTHRICAELFSIV